MMLYQVGVKILDDSKEIHYEDTKKELDPQILLQVKRGQIILLQNQDRIYCKISLTKMLGELKNQQNPITRKYIIKEKRKINKYDADLSLIPILQISRPSGALVEKLNSMFLDRQLRFKSPLSYTPLKQIKTSLLSSESPQQQYRGFINLAILMLISLHIRNIIDNLNTYGVRLNSMLALSRGFAEMFYLLGLIVPSFTGWGIIYLMTNSKLPISFACFLSIVNSIGVLIYCLLVCKYSGLIPPIGIVFCTFGMMLFLKLLSYLHVGYEVTKILNAMKSKVGSINDNFCANDIDKQNAKLLQKQKPYTVFSLGRFIRFLAFPTLCYQMQYPRSQKIRTIWLLKRIIQFICICALQLYSSFNRICIFQYLKPQLDQWVTRLQQGQPFRSVILSRLLKLAIPNLLFWISGFYSFFHLWCNILAQITYFGDRNFYGVFINYQDWWNCTTLEQYWKLWNLPVHFWFIRHVYNPLLKKGFSRTFANSAVFFISAVAHQYLVSVPLQIISFWAFVSMMMQAPVIFFQRTLQKVLDLKDSQLGNVSFWLIFCFLGQPVMLFIYYYEYHKHYN